MFQIALGASNNPPALMEHMAKVLHTWQRHPPPLETLSNKYHPCSLHVSLLAWANWFGDFYKVLVCEVLLPDFVKRNFKLCEEESHPVRRIYAFLVRHNMARLAK